MDVRDAVLVRRAVIPESTYRYRARARHADGKQEPVGESSSRSTAGEDEALLLRACERESVGDEDVIRSPGDRWMVHARDFTRRWSGVEKRRAIADENEGIVRDGKVRRLGHLACSSKVRDEHGQIARARG